MHWDSIERTSNSHYCNRNRHGISRRLRSDSNCNTLISFDMFTVSSLYNLHSPSRKLTQRRITKKLFGPNGTMNLVVSSSNSSWTHRLRLHHSHLMANRRWMPLSGQQVMEKEHSRTIFLTPVNSMRSGFPKKDDIVEKIHLVIHGITEDSCRQSHRLRYS